MFVIHSAEAVHMVTGRLRRYQVECFSGVWWEWVADNFFEGAGAYVRFDEMVKEKREAKEKGKPEGLKKGKH